MRLGVLLTALLLCFAMLTPEVGAALDNTVYCEGNGTSGYRAVAYYVYPADTVSDFTNRRNAIRESMAWIDNAWYAASGNRQHPRFSCYADTHYPRIVQFKGPKIGSDKVITFSEIRTALQKAGYVDSIRIYLLFVDNISIAYASHGQATVEFDDRPGQDNPNNTGPAYAMVDTDKKGWSVSAIGSNMWHEFGHTLGGVQCSAPHSSCPAGERGKHHCYDESDVMCYDDNGSYFNGLNGILNDGDDRPIWQRCFGYNNWDCGKDDYYNYAPAAGSYLATHWNTARSRFLTP